MKRDSIRFFSKMKARRHGAHLAFLALVLTWCGATAVAQTPAKPVTINIALSNFAITPDSVNLVHGQSYVLHLENRSGSGHDFSAPELFAKVAAGGGDWQRLRNGKIELPAHTKADLAFVAPQAGNYRFRCTHTLHSAFGMHGHFHVS